MESFVCKDKNPKINKKHHIQHANDSDKNPTNQRYSMGHRSQCLFLDWQNSKKDFEKKY